jgi:hypothetical protein
MADVSIIGIRDVEKMEMHLAKLHRGIYSSAPSADRSSWKFGLSNVS